MPYGIVSLCRSVPEKQSLPRIEESAVPHQQEQGQDDARDNEKNQDDFQFSMICSHSLSSTCLSVYWLQYVMPEVTDRGQIRGNREFASEQVEENPFEAGVTDIP